MEKIEKYLCSICGREFDDECECMEHELIEKFESNGMAVIFFGQNFNEISLKDALLNGVSVIEAFRIFEEEAISLVKDLFEEIGLYSPWEPDSGGLSEKTGLYVWDDDRGHWYMPAKVIEEMNEILQKYGVDA